MDLDLEHAHIIALQTIGNLMVQITFKDSEIAFLKDQLKVAMERATQGRPCNCGDVHEDGCPVSN